MMDKICQIGIFLTGLPAIYFLNKGYKWASIIGLVGQVFWFITTYQNKQWGIFILCFGYTYSWYLGTIRYFKEIKGE